MSQPPETVLAHSARVSCDGSGGIRSTGGYAPSALGHPRVYLEIDEKGFVECPYCDKRFVLDSHAQPDHSPAGAEHDPGNAGPAY
jgi:uncharacterized Zn-finger protein